MTTHIHDGYIEDVISERDYLNGTLEPTILVPDRNWRTYIPEGERQQKNSIETNNCTSFGTHNALEALVRCVTGKRVNFSDRYLGIRSGNTGSGNSPHKVIETLRKFAGTVPEKELPFTSNIKTIDDYYSGVSFAHRVAGVKWLMQYEVQHEWVLTGQETNWQDALYDTLQFSPIGIAVQAWGRDGEYYVRMGPDTHWCVLVGADKGKYWLVADSYAPYFKKLEWDFGFMRAKRYSITPRKSRGIKFYSRIGAGLLAMY